MGGPWSRWAQRVRWGRAVAAGLLLAIALVGSTSSSCARAKDGPRPPSSQGVGGAGGDGAGGLGSGGSDLDGGLSCTDRCSLDLHAVVDCHGTVLKSCQDTDGCDVLTATCVNACDAAQSAKRSVGCEYYAVFMDQLNAGSCFAAFVANTWNVPAHIQVAYDGANLPVVQFAYTTLGNGPGLVYQPFNPATGIQPGEVVIIFLAGPDGTPAQGNPVCPLPSAVPSGAMLANQTGKGKAFRITSDVPVVAYQINPYGGGSAAVTGASLLLPTSAWGDNYIAVNAYDSGPHPASLNIVAAEDDTLVTMLPVANIQGGGGLPPGSANGAFSFTLQAGEHAQLTQSAALTGSILESDKPIGFFAGARCSQVPNSIYACDHLEQMIPPVRALGAEYAAVMHRPRSGEPGLWRLIGAVDGTTLSWSSDVGGPTALDQGQVVELSTNQPFVVKSEDDAHPFILMGYMTGGSTNGMDGEGDADSVLVIPPAQWLDSYTFFSDPTYPETNLVVVRDRDDDGAYQDVTLDCLGPLTGWKQVGDYQYTRVDLVTGDFQPVGMCSTGAHTMASDARFGLWVWGWGTPNTSVFTKYVSYAYPAGMNATYLNDVVLTPK